MSSTHAYTPKVSSLIELTVINWNGSVVFLLLKFAYSRCMGYKPATHTGATDGRCQAEQELKRRFNKPRLFQLLPRKSYYGATISNSSFSNKNHTKQQDIRKSPTKPKTTPIKWDVICKTFISPWAENLGLGATQKEREADIYLKTHTRIWKFYDDSAPVQCQLCVSLNDNKNHLLDILRVASRGRLLSQNHTKAKNTTFCAPWFKGEDEWFSLSLYLSNRFEVSLVEAYRSHRHKLNNPQPTSDLEQALNRASAQVIRQSIDQATGKAFLELLKTSDPNSNILDNPLWKIFETPTSKLTHALPNYIVSSYDPFNPKTLAQVLCSAPLVLSKQENLHFHLLVQKHLKHCLATASEKSLLQAIKTSPVIASKKKKGKHKRNKECLRSTDTNPECITLPEATNESDSGDDDWVERIHPHRQCHHKPRQSPAQSISTPPTNEKTKMVVLTMVEDIIENACQLVGLIDAKDSKFEPCRGKKQGSVESYDRKPSILQYHHDSRTDCELHFNQTGSSFSHLFAQLDGSGLKDTSAEVLNCQRQSPSHLDPIYEPREPDRLLDMSAVGVSLDLSGAFDGWKGVKKFPREMSLFAEFFEEPKHYQNPVVASSTAASVASSMSDDAEVEQFVRMSDFELDSEEDGLLDEAVKSQQGEPSVTTHAAKAQALARDVMTQSPTVSTLSGSYLSTVKIDQFSKPSEGKPPTKMLSDPETSRSPRPSSPIQVSLAELGELKKKANTGELREELRRALPAIVVESAPNSPKLESIKIALTKSWSRDNLSKTPTNAVTKETQHCRRRSSSMRRSESLGEDKISRDSMPPSKETPYRQSSNPSLDRDKKSFNVTEPGSAYIPHQGNCASSVSALGDDSSLNWGEDPGAIVRSTSQGADEASISAPPPAKCHHDEREALLREERDAFRDMCLTLGAEVSKLRNLLAAEACTHYNPVMPYGVPAPYHYYHVVPPLHPGFAPPYYNASAPGTVRVAMSDAGLTRGSEDGIDLGGRQNLHQLGDGATIGGSDVSVEFTGKTYLVAVAGAPKGDSRPDMTHGIHSRLSTDISRFLELVSSQLRKTENKRRTAISRFKRMVGVIWPRAQVKMYGSHVSNLCLPGSDLDFVICLPAVHKNAPAVTPGVLEGRNAINETWQKLLARNLKGESWIDPRTIKIIERTAVPVIKVSTKDALSKVLQLDISFDGPGHHGLEAIEMVKSMMQVRFLLFTVTL